MIVAAYGATAHISTMYYHTSSATTFQCVAFNHSIQFLNPTYGSPG